jgi:SAM-dependent methyltransferase
MGMRERFDDGARLYARYWAPVLFPSAMGVLDRYAGLEGSPPGRLVDLGTGTGSLAIAAARRFRGAEVIGVDFSRGMLGVARSLAADELTGDASRLRWVEADAAALPLEGASVDAVVSSFVLQLVPARRPVYRELLRVLRPGGRLVFVTWCVDQSPFAPADLFEDTLEELEVDVEEPPEEPRAGDFASVRAAADSLRRAGFRAVRAEPATLEYRFTRESYFEYKVRYDDRTLLAGLRPSVRRRLEGRYRERLAKLSDDAFVLRSKIVYASAIRPGQWAGGSEGPPA